MVQGQSSPSKMKVTICKNKLKEQIYISLEWDLEPYILLSIPSA